MSMKVLGGRGTLGELFGLEQSLNWNTWKTRWKSSSRGQFQLLCTITNLINHLERSKELREKLMVAVFLDSVFPVRLQFKINKISHRKNLLFLYLSSCWAILFWALSKWNLSSLIIASLATSVLSIVTKLDSPGIYGKYVGGGWPYTIS